MVGREGLEYGLPETEVAGRCFVWLRHEDAPWASEVEASRPPALDAGAGNLNLAQWLLPHENDMFGEICR